MKRYGFALLVVGALLMGGAMAAPGRAEGPKTQRAVVVFDEPVKLLGVILKGEYIFVHDDERMAKGEDYSYVYARENGQQGRLVISFHCIPVQREAVDHFTVMIGGYDPVTHLAELLEYRFAGSAEGHKVPLAQAANP
jgi:hypothetical protein